MSIISWVIFCLVAALTVGGLIIAMVLDWQEGARQSYIHRDGTIREWDRFGNVATVRPDDSVEVHIEDAENGMGPTYLREMENDSQDG